MNNKTFKLCGLSASVAMLLVLSGPVLQTSFAAGDMAAPFNWSGVYAGAHLGYGWADADAILSPLPSALFTAARHQVLDPGPAGILGGAQVGYNMQKGMWVVGVETDLSLTDMDATKVRSPIIGTNGTPWVGTGSGITAHQDTDWFGTLRLRAGVVPAPKVLLYATGGLAYGHVNYSANTNFGTGNIQYRASTDSTKVGWTIGAGAEYAINNKWSVKTEYLYYDLGNETYTANGSPLNPPYQVRYEFETTAHIVNIGVNYRF